ncbi:MAG: hypothetical protein JW727_06645 [Candidatus Aenigmarchaeota archaeon]|nr:hypothetical protein [Candidatus Aenigmarchaeota archaeon]
MANNGTYLGTIDVSSSPIIPCGTSVSGFEVTALESKDPGLMDEESIERVRPGIRYVTLCQGRTYVSERPSDRPGIYFSDLREALHMNPIEALNHITGCKLSF